MESSGKILVVAGVLAIIMAGLFVYLFLLDRKLRRLEKQIEDKQHPPVS